MLKENVTGLKNVILFCRD